MLPLLLSEAIVATFRSRVKLIATDMDGTLTRGGKFAADLLDTLEKLSEARLRVLIVTGRSAGWVSGLASYLPVDGAIAENGGLFYDSRATFPVYLTQVGNIERHRTHLRQAFEELRGKFPQLQESADNRFRLTDWTFDVAGLSEDMLGAIATDCKAMGWGFTYSTVQGHIKPLQQDKATGLHHVLQQYFPDCLVEAVLTVGDSPNDASLFDPRNFPLSVGVANVLDYQGALPHLPRYVTAERESKGFCELGEYLLK
ncbi:MAG: HAD family phosphatase [Coleofasciculaceae cyanobacterium SM2_3_26]|nr:HAD family phosphatase [Coleofasciculaceae cyanobacterium SM2_3_26]